MLFYYLNKCFFTTFYIHSYKHISYLHTHTHILFSVEEILIIFCMLLLQIEQKNISSFNPPTNYSLIVMTKKTGKKDKQQPKQKEIKEVEVKETPDTTNDIEGDLNSGFSSYLQSSSGNNQCFIQSPFNLSYQ